MAEELRIFHAAPSGVTISRTQAVSNQKPFDDKNTALYCVPVPLSSSDLTNENITEIAIVHKGMKLNCSLIIRSGTTP